MNAEKRRARARRKAKVRWKFNGCRSLEDRREKNEARTSRGHSPKWMTPTFFGSHPNPYNGVSRG